MLGDMSLIEVLKLLAPILVIEFGFKIFCLVRLARDRVKYLPKWAWALIILCINPFLGSLAFMLLGRVKD